MLPREKNGVVDPQLKVYGTKNIRVVDLSVATLMPSVHPQGETLIESYIFSYSDSLLVAVVFTIAEIGMLL